jgi:phosphoribosylaminoimidazole-succinocarboxamide synthase
MISTNEIKTLLPVAFKHSELPLPGKHSGKVRDIYPLEDNRQLMITTDRLSAFDRVLASVPFKGQVLNQLSGWWFDQTRSVIPNHVIDLPDPNALVAWQAEPFPVEVIVRGYITGVTSTALWYRYSLGERDIYGYHFPPGLRKNEQLAQPIITPTTKGGPTGHDERLTCNEVVQKGLLDAQTWEQVQEAALAVFALGQQVASQAGLILVDTKYEFGRLPEDSSSPNGKIALIDEVHTPDSSRFWKADTYLERFERGEEPENFDKEFIRIAYAQLGYRGDGTPPEMTDDLWVSASQRYITIYETLTGKRLIPGDYPVEPRLVANLRKNGVLR